MCWVQVNTDGKAAFSIGKWTMNIPVLVHELPVWKTDYLVALSNLDGDYTRKPGRHAKMFAAKIRSINLCIFVQQGAFAKQGKAYGISINKSRARYRHWPDACFKTVVQFRPSVFKFYWPDGPVVSIQLTTVYISVIQPFIEKSTTLIH